MKRTKRRQHEGLTAEINLFDEATGEIEKQSTFKIKTKLGSGWVPFYKKSLNKLLEECPKFSILKVYLKLAARQTYNKFVIVTQAQIARELKTKPTTVSEAIKWLREHRYLQVHQVDGNTGYLLNANVTLCGTSNISQKAEIWQLQKQKDYVESTPAEELDMAIERRQKLLESLDSLISSKILEEDPEDDTDEAFTEDIPPFDTDLLK